MNFGIKYPLMNILEGGAGGGGGNDGAASDAGSGGIDPTAAPTFTPPEWAKGINVDQEILKAPMFSTIKTVDDVVKGFYHAQKLVGADKIGIPNKNSSPEEWKNYYVKAGLPAEFAEYKVELPKSFENKEFNDNLLKTAYENNIQPDQLKKVMDLIEADNEKLINDYQASETENKQRVLSELKQEWGQGLEKQLHVANRAIKHFAGDEMHKQIVGSELSNNKEFIQLMAKIGSKMTTEDSFPNEVTATFGMTKEEARSKLNAMMGDMNSPYHNSDHASHKDFVSNMLKYQEILSN